MVVMGQVLAVVLSFLRVPTADVGETAYGSRDHGLEVSLVILCG